MINRKEANHDDRSLDKIDGTADDRLGDGGRSSTLFDLMRRVLDRYGGAGIG